MLSYGTAEWLHRDYAERSLHHHAVPTFYHIRCLACTGRNSRSCGAHYISRFKFQLKRIDRLSFDTNQQHYIINIAVKFGIKNHRRIASSTFFSNIIFLIHYIEQQQQQQLCLIFFDYEVQHWLDDFLDVLHTAIKFKFVLSILDIIIEFGHRDNWHRRLHSHGHRFQQQLVFVQVHLFLLQSFITI